MPRSLEDFAVFAAPVVFVVLWASGFAGAKFGLPYAEPMTFLSLRMAAAIALLAVVIVVTRPKWPDRTGLLHSIVAGSLVHGAYLGGVFASIENGISAGLIALIVSLQPVLTSTLANRWLGERVLPRQWLGLVLGIAGVYLIVRENVSGGDIKPIAWAFAVLALTGITVGTLYQKRFGGGIDWRPALCIQYATADVLFIAAAFAFETRAVHWTPQFVFALAWLVLLLSFGAVWLLYYLIRRSAATRVVSLMYLTPPVTALMAWLLFNERLALLGLLGMAICVTGVFLVNWRTGGTTR